MVIDLKLIIRLNVLGHIFMISFKFSIFNKKVISFSLKFLFLLTSHINQMHQSIFIYSYIESNTKQDYFIENFIYIFSILNILGILIKKVIS